MAHRGFTAQAERLAIEVRDELDLEVNQPFNPYQLATFYSVPIHPITELVSCGANPDSIRQLTLVDPDCFSAGTVLVGTSRLIVFNPTHPKGRRANSLSHELAHLLLEHVPGPAIDLGGCRIWNKEMEEEANLLASALLVPREAALACARVGLPYMIGAARYGVSEDLMKWRINQSGAVRQAQNEARKYGRKIHQIRPVEELVIKKSCNIDWLHDISPQTWNVLLKACGIAIASGSTSEIIACLTQPSWSPY